MSETGGDQREERLMPREPGWRRYPAIYGLLWRNSLVREMGFKANFLLWMVVELLWFALQLCFMGVIYSHTDAIGSWSKWQVVLLVGTSHFIQQIFTAFFLNNCVQLSETVRTGTLDFFLALPINTRFLVSCRMVDLGSFVNAASAVAVMAYAAMRLDLRIGILHIVWVLIICLVGVLVHYSLMFTLASISFWTVRAQGIVWGYYNLFNIARLPDEAFRGAFRAVFTFVLPMLLVSNVPARVLLDSLQRPVDLGLLFVLAAACLALSEWFWRVSLRRYTSASS